MSTKIKRRRGVLSIVGAFLLGSALLRFGIEAGPALADELAGTSEDVMPASMPEASPETLLAALRDRESRVAARESALRERMAVLREAESEIEEKLAELIAAEARLSATIALAESASEDDLAQLTTFYENMKPREAADLFAEMSPEFAAGFLGLMRADTAAAIMTELEPDVAYAFSVVLAGRNANTPTE